MGMDIPGGIPLLPPREEVERELPLELELCG